MLWHYSAARVWNVIFFTRSILLKKLMNSWFCRQYLFHHSLLVRQEFLILFKRPSLRWNIFGFVPFSSRCSKNEQISALYDSCSFNDDTNNIIIYWSNRQWSLHNLSVNLNEWTVLDGFNSWTLGLWTKICLWTPLVLLESIIWLKIQ